MIASSNNKPALQLALASVIFGIGAVLVVFIHLDAVVISFYRMFWGAVLFGGILLFRKQSLAINKKALFYSALAGVLFAIDLSFWNKSIHVIGPGIATILNSLQVFFMALVAVLFLNDKLSLKLLISLLASFVGVVLLCSNEIRTTENAAWGITAGILSAIAFTFSMIALREAANYQTASVISTMFYASLFGAATAGLWATIAGETFIAPDLPSWLWMTIYGVVVHVLAWLLMAVSMPHLSIGGFHASFKHCYYWSHLYFGAGGFHYQRYIVAG